ncbi:vWA domain-containing protein, partial [Flavobacterium frigoris]|uniref:vWA domain-containing protein n=1 Tax=Flavobacterium frigoris TaxID=229204 RepID=UPI001300C73C
MKTKITLLLLAFFMFVGNTYSQIETDPDHLGGAVYIGSVAPFTVPVDITGVQQKPSAKLAKNTSITGKTSVAPRLEWPNPGAVQIEKTAEATTTPGKWKINILTQGKNIPKTTDVVLVIDDSGSMSGNKISSARSAAKTFVSELLNNSTGIRIAVVTLNSPSSTGSPQLDQTFTNSTSTLNTAIDAIGASGGTNIQGGFYAARQLVNTSSADKKVVILLSDGDPTYSYQTTTLITPSAPSCSNSNWNISRSSFEAGMTVTSSNYGNVVGNGSSFNYALYTATSRNCNNFEAGNHGMPTKYEASLLINAGVDVYTIGFDVTAGGNAENTLSGSQNKGYFAATTANISNIYSQIRSNIAYAATNAVLTDPMSTYIVLQAGAVPSYSVIPSTTGNVVVSKGTVTFVNNGYVLNDPDNPASGNSSLIKWKIIWNIGTISEIGDTMYYYVTMAPNTNPTILYDANEKTYMDYTDVNGNINAHQETPTDFTIPKVSGGKGSIEIIYYTVNENGNPINSNGVVVPKENAVKIIPGNSKYYEYNGSTALDVNQNYTVSPEALYNSNSSLYQLYCTFGNISITPTPTTPNVVVWFGYRLGTKPTLTPTQPTCTVDTGSVTITGITGETYSFDGGPYSTNLVYSGLAASSAHTVTAKNAAGCISVVSNITLDGLLAKPTANAGTAFTKNCLTNISGGAIGEASETGYTYSWVSSP